MATPSATLMRRFCSALLVTRSRSGTGLKSTPKAVPFSAVFKLGAWVAAPVIELRGVQIIRGSDPVELSSGRPKIDPHEGFARLQSRDRGIAGQDAWSRAVEANQTAPRGERKDGFSLYRNYRA
jgi:hypothetical protein